MDIGEEKIFELFDILYINWENTGQQNSDVCWNEISMWRSMKHYNSIDV